VLVVGVLAFLFMYRDHMFLKKDQPEVTPYHQKLLIQTVKLAKQGRLEPSKDFPIGSTTKEIVAKWGKPDNGTDQLSWNYPKHHTVFHMDPIDVDKVDNIFTDAPVYSGLTVHVIRMVLGMPNNDSYSNENQLYSMEYQISNGYTIIFYFHFNPNGKLGKFMGLQLTFSPDF
jgi:hypothetical protein